MSLEKEAQEAQKAGEAVQGALSVPIIQKVVTGLMWIGGILAAAIALKIVFSIFS